ncbi:aspartate kinase [Tenacibaculum piscium]|uniref:aspartate kinase n=1 Tax=Tenacibaculum piscium TaxID=1458515 RepID=UPI00187B4F0D|nr:aspartate kinase [Tenacibaculum piscium]MBE7686199.1 aspartate kinase [Tenacibaculum piscium]MBE7689935.1 aspartate kinase [Tenacibaculum piscium]
MRIFKFGGASVKDADGVKNVARVLRSQGLNNVLVVISAMGKMTNAFEEIINAYFYQQENSEDNLKEAISFVEDFHHEIITDLFEENHEIFNKVDFLFAQLSGFMIQNNSKNYNYVYDQIVGFGELLSTHIVSAYLSEIDIKNQWIDVRECIKTDANFRDAKINWELTSQNITQKINKNISENTIYITQGFLGSTSLKIASDIVEGNQNFTATTTLGREGSDYTAGVFAYCLNAQSVTIWKDVAGVLNADPRVFSKTTLLHEISYTEAIEMAFYGASVIHPKTIQPLEQKNIPLFVRSFEDISNKGTCVGKGTKINPEIPCFIVKKNQILVSISAKDFSFMVESNISHVFEKLDEYQLKVNLIQNSAISFSVCIEDKYNTFDSFYQDLKSTFIIKVYKDVTLYTIRHFDEKALQKIREKGTAIIRQINTETAQLLIQ